MMPYIVVENVANDFNNEKVCKVGVYDTESLVRQGACTLVKLSKLWGHVWDTGYTPLNFSVTAGGLVQQDAGSFDRFHKDGVFIVLARYVSRNGRTVGYRLLSSLNGAIMAVRTEDILARAKRMDRPFLQNGIIRGDAVNCYPGHEYKALSADVPRGSGVRAVQVQQASQKVAGSVVKDRGIIPVVHNQDKAGVSTEEKFTPEQLREIYACRGKGIDSKFIEDTGLTPKQMRILWVSKSNGALSEYFSRPEYSVQAMKFYADRLFSKKLVQDCMPMLKVPTLTVDKLSELYMCVCDGVDYTDLLDLSASDINVERLKRTVFVDSNFTEDEMYDKAFSVLRKMNKLPSKGV